MTITDSLRALLAIWHAKPVSDWFVVTFDQQLVHLRATPPGRKAWSQDFPWDSIVRICFKPEFLASDGIYVYTSQRSESYVIPADATGGEQLWREILRRRLFDDALAAKAVLSADAVHCWPPAGPAA